MSEPFAPASERISQAADAADQHAANGTAQNGSASCGAEAPKQAADAQPGQADPTMARAEQMVDRFAAGTAEFTSKWGRRLWRVASRVREEVSDMWSEAQSIRRGQQS
jgi:hypothetical protein